MSLITSLVTFLLVTLLQSHIAQSASIPLFRGGWTATADSFQPGDEPAKAIDGNAGSIWHSRYDPTIDPLPNWINIDMKVLYLINGVSIQPRQDGNGNGRIGQHRIEVSTDNSNWILVATGTFANDATTKKTTFLPRPARYVRITALTEATSPSNAFTAAAEINVFGDVQYLSRSSWSVTADSSETGVASNAPANAIDGQTNTIWHTQYGSTVAPLPHWFRIDAGSQVTAMGLAYLPRQDGSRNGWIGQYNVQASNDSTTWTTVASGTWPDTLDEKVAQFQTRARYFRLNALSEAGGRGQWSSAADINLIDTGSPSYTPPVPNRGLFVNTVNFPIVPAAAAVLPNGKVLLWSAYKLDDFGGGTGLTQTAIYDPVTGTSTPRTVTNTAHDMFCPGISMDFNGRIIVTGGNNAQKTSIYNPSTDSWTAGADMVISRGYQSTATVSDGNVFNIGGSWSGGQGNKNGEVYNPTANTWNFLSAALVSPMLTNDAQGVYRSDNHAWLFGWKNRFAFQAGPSRAMNWYNTAGTGSTTGAGNRGNDGDSMNGNAVMYDAGAGKILTAGGAPNYQTNNAHNRAYVITLGDPLTNPTVSQTSSMASARGFANGVVLPDGTVLVAGGQTFVEPFSDATATNSPELWNPATGTWTPMNPHAIPRTYHSVALLLPDATVLHGGGGLCGACGTNHWDGEIFVPPYLLNSDGTRRARPSITNVASTVSVGATLSVTTGGAVSRFSLVRLGTATHTVNTDQRRVALTSSGSGTSYTVTIPSDPGVALPGYWFLFAINSAGTPSVARIIRVTL